MCWMFALLVVASGGPFSPFFDWNYPSQHQYRNLLGDEEFSPEAGTARWLLCTVLGRDSGSQVFLTPAMSTIYLPRTQTSRHKTCRAVHLEADFKRGFKVKVALNREIDEKCDEDGTCMRMRGARTPGESIWKGKERDGSRESDAGSKVTFRSSEVVGKGRNRRVGMPGQNIYFVVVDSSLSLPVKEGKQQGHTDQQVAIRRTTKQHYIMPGCRPAEYLLCLPATHSSRLGFRLTDIARINLEQIRVNKDAA
ncbi:uncharacterized protein EV420DRAFT_1485119 [Desarmillaria tabescens]|uniref:Uncharacterized protein n=1 Tax=Armillaria tabescens TaxID=1929756 RepID=A0AA39JCX0_ARMTA|nr:uncharacterized protein EV420DRAFT_1486175 [Desarmillaria tabescens]XP_060324503.1 uncharacterized protein EV420DRAFT_1485119 [Desarmillaria tabescens]KAK0439722.1 hypothetical protein EV420DRAFT_1486175 [Desarmillaria tabescens]KAK0443009.1 hypothetical protein EV420DRAFT_1485119 [Desarmillaria tabescens]